MLLKLHGSICQRTTLKFQYTGCSWPEGVSLAGKGWGKHSYNWEYLWLSQTLALRHRYSLYCWWLLLIIQQSDFAVTSFCAMNSCPFTGLNPVNPCLFCTGESSTGLGTPDVSPQGWAEGEDPLLWAAGHALPNAAQEAVGPKVQGLIAGSWAGRCPPGAPHSFSA